MVGRIDALAVATGSAAAEKQAERRKEGSGRIAVSEAAWNQALPGSSVPGSARAGPSWAAGIVREGKNDRNGSNRCGPTYDGAWARMVKW